MPSIIQKESYNSVKVFWLNKDLLIKKLKKYINIITKKRREIEKIILFGSFAENNFTAFSDIDLIFIVSESKERFIDRASIYMNFFRDINLELEIFVYTKEELKNLDIPLLKTALKTGKVLFEKIDKEKR